MSKLSTRTKTPTQFECVYCFFQCRKKSEWLRHLSTLKHKEHLQQTPKNANPTSVLNVSEKDHGPVAMPLPATSLRKTLKNTHTFECICGKSYLHRQSLHQHRPKCKQKEGSLNNTNVPPPPPTTTTTQTIENTAASNLDTLTNLVLNVVKQNQELQKQLVDMCKVPTNVSHNNINSHNKTFNLQFFLNEECKDAMNIMEFVDSFTLQLSDLESVGRMGYVEGISRIIMTKLKEMDIRKRPIHCSDVKREIMHVKDDNKWEKEDANYMRIRKAIKCISRANSRLLVDWRHKHLGASNENNDQYLKLIQQALGGYSQIEDNENKIIRRIAREVVINK